MDVKKRPFEPLEPCPACGTLPGASIEVGEGFLNARIRCGRCGLGTSPGQSYERARQEWREMARPIPAS
jgi:hypothetical protein